MLPIRRAGSAVAILAICRTLYRAFGHAIFGKIGNFWINIPKCPMYPHSHWRVRIVHDQNQTLRARWHIRKLQRRIDVLSVARVFRGDCLIVPESGACNFHILIKHEFEYPWFWKYARKEFLHLPLGYENNLPISTLRPNSPSLFLPPRSRKQ